MTVFEKIDLIRKICSQIIEDDGTETESDLSYGMRLGKQELAMTILFALGDIEE